MNTIPIDIKPEEIKGAVITGYCGSIGSFLMLQIRLEDGRDIELHPSKSNAMIDIFNQGGKR